MAYMYHGEGYLTFNQLGASFYVFIYQFNLNSQYNVKK